MIARAFVAQGAKVYISSRGIKDTGIGLTERDKYDCECIFIPEDVSTIDGCRRLATKFSEMEPSLDILVNNAGTSWGCDFEKFPEQGWDRVMNLNLKAPFFITQFLHGTLKAAASRERPAKVINIASIDGIQPSADETYSYQASKAGLIFLTRRMAARLIGDAINVTAIAPGHFPSDLNRRARDYSEEVAHATPARRVGRWEDIAGAAIYLASRAGDYVVGDTLVVDGGRSLAKVG